MAHLGCFVVTKARCSSPAASACLLKSAQELGGVIGLVGSSPGQVKEETLIAQPREDKDTY